MRWFAIPNLLLLSVGALCLAAAERSSVPVAHPDKHGAHRSAFEVGLSPEPLKAAEKRKETRSTELGIQEHQFTVNRQVQFLYGISYYGALGAPEESIRQDLDEMQRHGFNWFRMWANWAAFGANVSVVDEGGAPREPMLFKLKWLIAECDRRAMLVDVTLSRGNGIAGPPRLQTLEAHQRSVQTITSALKPWRNWYFDLSNERNIQDQRFASFEDLKILRQMIKEIDPGRLVTASHAGDLTRQDLREYLQTVEVDFISPHRPRNADSPGQTEEKTKIYLQWMREGGKVIPVHYQEPFRRGFGRWDPIAADFMADAKGAKAGGAAGWCFHNGDQRSAPDRHPRRSFDLRDKRLFEQLDNQERQALDLLEKVMSNGGRRSL